MESSISILNLLSGVFLTIIVILISFRLKKEKSKALVFTLIAFIILLAVTGTNIFEHFFQISSADTYEDYIEILFIPFLIFAIFTSSLDQEHKAKLLEQKKLKAIFNQAFSFIGLLDKDGRLIETNETAIRFLNCEPDEHKGKYFWDTPYWTHSQAEIEKLKKAIHEVQQGKTVRAETTHIDPTGKIHYIDFTLKPIFDDHNQLLYMIPEGRDITDTIIARNELEAHKQNLEYLVKERTEELEIVNEEIRAINEELFNKNEILKKNKEELETTLARLKDAQMQLIESEKMSSLGLLTAGIAHEINNPVNFINSGVMALKKSLQKNEQLLIEYNKLLERMNIPDLISEVNQLNIDLKKDENLAAVHTLLEHIETGVDRTINIVQSLRFFARNDGDEFVPVDIHELIDAVLIILYNEYKNRITIEKDYQLKQVANCIPGKLNQVFMNIIFNAIQAIPNKGTIYISTSLKDGKITISVKDTGVGISPEFIKHIFEPFFTTKPVGKGTGLGLSISYKIIEQHNGHIVVNSEKGSGAEFIIELPV